MMQRSFALAAERSRYKERLEASLAALCELDLLKHRQEALVLSALRLGDSGSGCGRAAWPLVRHCFHNSADLQPEQQQSMEKIKKSKELSEDVRTKIVEKYGRCQGYKSISRDLNVPVSTVRHIIKKFTAHGTVANLPGRGRKRKIDGKLQQRIVQMVAKEPQSTSKQIQADLQTLGATVSARTIRRHLNEMGCFGHC